MKLLIFAIDGMSPIYTKNWLDDLPTIKKIANQGGLLKMPSNSWSSCTNWASIYTGTEKQTHKVLEGTIREGNESTISDIAVEPWWITLGREHNLKTGVMSPLMIDQKACNAIHEVGGWMTGFNNDLPYSYKLVGRVEETLYHSSPEIEALVDWSKHKGMHIPDPPTIIPTDGVSDNGLKITRDVYNAQSLIPKDYYSKGVDELKESLELKLENCKKLQEKYPVDIMIVYDVKLDIISHCTHHDPELKVLKKAYEVVDEALAHFIGAFQPLHKVVISDHGFQAVPYFQEGSYNVIVSGQHTLPCMCAFTFPGFFIQDFAHIAMKNVFGIKL